MAEKKGSTFTRRQIVEGMRIEDEWFSNMTKLGVFETINPDVGRGRERQYDPSEIWVIGVIARIARRTPQQPTSFLRKVASATREVVGELEWPGEVLNPVYLTLDYLADGAVKATIRRSSDYAAGRFPFLELRLVEDDTEIINLFNLSKMYPPPSEWRHI